MFLIQAINEVSIKSFYKNSNALFGYNVNFKWSRDLMINFNKNILNSNALFGYNVEYNVD